MTCAAKLNLTICQGSTFRLPLRWGQARKAYKPITGATRAAPCVLTVTAHGVPDGWPIFVESVRGMEELNAEIPYVPTVIDANTIELPVNALDFTAYAGGGTIVYHLPVDLAGYTARAHIRETQDATATILTLTTENGGIVIDNAAKTVTLVLTATQTAALSFDSAVYDLELVSGGGEVYRIAYGDVKLSLETTR